MNATAVTAATTEPHKFKKKGKPQDVETIKRRAKNKVRKELKAAIEKAEAVQDHDEVGRLIARRDRLERRWSLGLNARDVWKMREEGGSIASREQTQKFFFAR